MEESATTEDSSVVRQEGKREVGSPLMVSAQSVAIDLPQKALAWEDESGQVWFSYNDADYLDQRHGVGECGGVLDKG